MGEAVFLLHIGKRTAGLWVLAMLFVFWMGVIVLSYFRPQDAIKSDAMQEETTSVLVIDPGHGGSDGGACGLHGTIESTINWSIAARVHDAASFLGIPAVMTRDSEDILYPAEAVTISAQKKWDTRQRVEKINMIPGGTLLSIHQNFYPSESPCGSEVLFGNVGESRVFAEIIQQNMVNLLNPDNRRVAIPARRDIYIMQHVNCPAVLVECGFLSNERESVLLCDERYTIKIAAILAASFLQYAEEFDL